MLNLIIWVFIIGFGLVITVVVAAIASATETPETRAVRQTATLAWETAKSDKLAYFAEAGGEWPWQSECKYDGQDAVMALHQSGNIIAIVRYYISPDFIISPPLELAVSEITSVEVVRRERIASYNRTELVPVSITRKRSSIGRGIVGGLIAGPAGAVVGAASGLGGTSQVRSEERNVSATRVEKGPPELVLGTASMERPVIRARFKEEAIADEWLHRIRAAQARKKSFRDNEAMPRSVWPHPDYSKSLRAQALSQPVILGSDYLVRVSSVGNNRVKIIGALQEACPELSLSEATRLTSTLPSIIKRNIPIREAERIKSALQREGAVVTIE